MSVLDTIVKNGYSVTISFGQDHSGEDFYTASVRIRYKHDGRGSTIEEAVADLVDTVRYWDGIDITLSVDEMVAIGGLMRGEC